MRICLISSYSGTLGEGMRNVAFHFDKELTKRHEVLHLSLDALFSKEFWKKIKNFNPQIIHYVPGRTIKSFVIAKVLKFCCNNNAKIAMSVMLLNLHPLGGEIISLFKPDLVLTQSYKTERLFTKLGCKTEFLPSGINIKKFIPVSKGVKEALRGKYRIDKEKFIILHVGHINKGRNIQILNKLQQKGNNQVIIVTSSVEPIEHKVYKNLKESGCIVWRTYFENIEEIYALSDCYVFPTTDTLKCIELPLSVMEAMSCNLPIISTKFGALPRVFEEGNGLIFVDKEEDFVRELERIKKRDIEIKTREKVLPYSWENVVRKLEEIYEELIEI